jgi:hypothetical protein
VEATEIFDDQEGQFPIIDEALDLRHEGRLDMVVGEHFVAQEEGGVIVGCYRQATAVPVAAGPLL